MKKLFAVTAALALLGLGVGAQAIIIDTVTVGDAGNAADTCVMSDGTTGYGSVSYTYNIGKYEVTAGQYTAFLNAVAKTDTNTLYNTNMANTSYGSGISRSGSSGNYTYTVDAAFTNRPVNYVSFWDACRFTNWLGNGQKTGAQDATTTEDGAYTLDGYTGDDGHTIQRNAGWTWAVTSEDEWYKAAYYKGGSTDAGYWLYSTQSNTAPGSDMADPSGNNANYYNGYGSYPIDSGKYTTVVGEFQNSVSAYGTFDQGGNLWEWNDTLYDISRGQRGGSCFDGTEGGNGQTLRSTKRCFTNANYDYLEMGFRVFQAYSSVPEPSSIIVLLGGLTGLIGLRRRKA
ncbi:formylglycine-generating enzyme family protein [bacterium]|nr:formylglycine-generating enzyme family protein [bacterium]